MMRSGEKVAAGGGAGEPGVEAPSQVGFLRPWAGCEVLLGESLVGGAGAGRAAVGGASVPRGTRERSGVREGRRLWLDEAGGWGGGS